MNQVKMSVSSSIFEVSNFKMSTGTTILLEYIISRETRWNHECERIIIEISKLES